MSVILLSCHALVKKDTSHQGNIHHHVPGKNTKNGILGNNRKRHGVSPYNHTRKRRKTMRNWQINPLLWIGLTGMIIFGSIFIPDIYKAIRGDSGIWWTHQKMKLPIEQTKGHFELYIGGRSLQKHLSEKTLYSVDKNGKQYPVVSGDIAVRLNNWEKVKSSILMRTTIIGFVLGVVVTLFTVGLVLNLRRDKKPC